MAIFKRGKVYWFEFTFKGNRIRESTHQGNQNVARQMMAARRTALAKGEVGIRDHVAVPALHEFASRFVAAIETQCANKPRTIAFYKSKLAALLAYEPLASCALDRIDEARIDEYKQYRSRTTSRRKKPLSAASINRELATLRRLLRLAEEWKVITRVPRIRLLSGEHQREFVLPHDREDEYFGRASRDLRDVAVIMVDAGLRVGEALQLRWSDVQLEASFKRKYGHLTVIGRNAKNSKTRRVPLTARSLAVLKSRWSPTADLVFERDGGGPLSATWLDQQHAKIRSELAFPVEFVLHSLRHTFGTRLGEAGADAFTIMKLMGHSTITVSQRYVHPTPEGIELAFERLEIMNAQKARAARTAGGVPTNSTTSPSEEKVLAATSSL
jgi:integrase